MPINVPNEVFTKILFMLDLRSLQSARQVSSEWKTVIEEQVLGTERGRRWTLQLQWKEATPAKLEFTIEGLPYPSTTVLDFTDQFAVICSFPDPHSDPDLDSWVRWVRLVNFVEGVVLMEISGGVCGALITEDVLLLSKFDDDVWDLDRMFDRQLLAWNIHTKQEIFNKEFSNDRVVFDHHNKQVMVGSNTRLAITGATVIETSQTPLPEGSDLQFFSHPHYLTKGHGGGGGPGTLWKVDGTEVNRVGELGAGGICEPVFCPAREIVVDYSHLLSDKIKLRVHSSLTLDLIKERVLTIPTAINRIDSLQVNSKQVVLMVRQPAESHAILLVYELDSLLSQAADQEISARMFQVGQPGFYVAHRRIYLSKTTVSVMLEEEDSVMFKTLDFLNCGD